MKLQFTIIKLRLIIIFNKIIQEIIFNKKKFKKKSLNMIDKVIIIYIYLRIKRDAK